MRVLLIFEMQEIKGALFLKANFLSYALLSWFVTVIVPLTTISASLKSHRSYLNIGVLNLIRFLGLYLSSALPDWSWTSLHFLIINLGTLSDVVSSKLVVF